MWQKYDDTRNMSVLTAYGLTEGIKPECGAWGQGVSESPIELSDGRCWANVTEPLAELKSH